jgi:flagellar basal-body rod protein FlgB
MTSAALPVVDQVAAALSASSLQHQVIVNNIANRDTEGYQRLKLRFDDAMDRAGATTVVADHTGADVSVEQDMIALSANTLRYQSLAHVLARYFAIVTTISNSNRG